MPGPVVIVDYDPHWPDLFEELRAPVAAALGDLVVIVEHVGSTAVPGLAAKPIIDMDVVVPSVADIPEAIGRLATSATSIEASLGFPGAKPSSRRPGSRGTTSTSAPSAARNSGATAYSGTTC